MNRNKEKTNCEIPEAVHTLTHTQYLLDKKAICSKNSTKSLVGAENRKNANAKMKVAGITLIALVVTVIVLLILSGVTISTVFGEDGIIKKAVEAKDAQVMAVVKDQMEMAGLNWQLSKGLDDTINVDDFFNSLVQMDIIDSRADDVTGPDENGIYTVTTKDGFIFDVIIDEQGNIDIEYVGKESDENLPPRVSINVIEKTTSHIKIQAKPSRLGNGNITYYYKLSSDSNENYTQIGEGTTETTCDFTNLQSNTSYDIKVAVHNSKGDFGKVISVKTEALSNSGIQQKGETTWYNGLATIELESTETGYTIQYQVNGTNGTWIDYTIPINSLSHGDTVFVRAFDGTSGSEEKGITIIDNVPPVIAEIASDSTSNSVSLQVSVIDNEAGMGDSPTYSFYIKKQTEPESSYVKDQEGASNSYTKTGLEQGIAYTLKVEATDKAGNIQTYTKELTTRSIDGANDGLQTGAIIASAPTWSNGTASITLSTTTGLTIQWQKGGIAEGNWTTGTSVTGINHNETIFARLTDGKNYGDEASVTVLDGNNPQTATISLGATTANTGVNVTATVTHNDNESGPNIANCKWVYNTTSGTIGTNPSSYTGTFSSNGQSINLNASLPGSYYLHVLTVDKAGRATESIKGPITVKAALAADGNFNSTKGINTPKLGTGMTAIKWNGSSWVNTTGDDADWYDYSNKKWANAKTSDGSMWVWIPRYAYQITTNYSNGGSGVSGNINIKFMKGTTNEAADGTTSWNNASGSGKWNIHPAFTYGSTVPGIWVAKFEASHSDASSSSAGSSSTLKIQPGVQSWRSITISNIYSTCLSYNTTLNSHQMKNSEWGAVAYLAQSTYGKNSEVWINPNSNFITGQAGTSVSASGTTSTHAYTDTTYGVNASTTGNVTGIYDMSGGTYEYVAAYVNNGNGNLSSYGSNLVNGAAKTKDVYSTSSDSKSNNYNAAASVYGDAVYETSSSYSGNTSWYGDYSYFPYSGSPFFVRGGYFSLTPNAGLFFFFSGNGNSYSNYGFRPVLVAF